MQSGWAGFFKVSFDYRRKWVSKLQGQVTVKKVLERYSGLRYLPTGNNTSIAVSF